MKIIHTSDWHLGQNFYGYDRRDEHAHMVGQLRTLVEQQQPDVLVIAGDVYDIGSPNTVVQKDFAKYLVSLCKACPDMTIVCIAGNHDSASRHEVFQEPWEAFGVYTVGKVNMNDVKSNIIKVKDKGYVVAVPYTNERFLDDDFYQKLSAAVEQECGVDGLPVIYVGHASIMDLDYDGHKTADENKYVGNIECTSVERIGDVYDYIALGHIHKAQTFYNGRARYCGSPIPVSFDEVKPGYDHGFTIVDIAGKGEVPVISTVPVECVRPLVNIPSVGFATWADAMAELKKFPAGQDAYIRLNIEVEEHESLPYDRETQISNALLGKQGKYCLINVTRKSSVVAGKSEVAPMELEELQNEDPLTLVKRYFASEGIEFIGDFEDMFNEAVAAVKSVQDEN